jgi:indolepyruvate ferredoxin oxidoreductase
MVHQFAEGLMKSVVEEKRSIEDQLTGQLYNWPVGKRPWCGEFERPFPSAAAEPL